MVGGGINGCGIARDAAGRGLRVVLVEQADLASATSSASSKLVHGGLRYLEQLEFRLVAEALAEREILLRTAPHLVQPRRFIMPHAPGLRSAWLIRAGLFLYDFLAGGQTLPRSTRADLTRLPYSSGLQPQYARGSAYSDCWVDDARLVIANARAAADLGARIMTRTKCVSAHRESGAWRVRLSHADGEVEVRARALVNAAGPWAGQFRMLASGRAAPVSLRLVQGSHIVVRRLYDGDHAFIVQNTDGRVIFVYGYEGAYTLIGTTEVELDREPAHCRPTPAEVDYLCDAANRYFAKHIVASDVVWSYCGVRALVDDGARQPSRVTREYVLHLDAEAEAPPLLSVLGGKITTFRRLAERALDKLAPWFPGLPETWTATAPLPGGDVASGAQAYTEALAARRVGLPRDLLRTLVRRHGTRAAAVLDTAVDVADLGEHFGEQLYAREIDYFIKHEWASEGEDILWRRTKTGLHLSQDQQAKVRAYVARRRMALCDNSR